MGLFSSAVAEVNIDFYGQKRINKAFSNVQVFYNVTLTPYNLDPRYLGDLYAKAFTKYSDIPIMPMDRELFWTYVNESLKNVLVNPSSLFYIWPGFIDIAPANGQASGKKVFVKVSLMDNGKVKYKYTENAVNIYYNTIAPIALLQYIMSLLPTDQFQIFFDVFRQRMDEEIRSSKRSDSQAFKLEPLPVFASVAVQPMTQMKKICGACGTEIVPSGGVMPQFCGACGSPVA